MARPKGKAILVLLALVAIGAAIWAWMTGSTSPGIGKGSSAADGSSGAREGELSTYGQDSANTAGETRDVDYYTARPVEAAAYVWAWIWADENGEEDQ